MTESAHKSFHERGPLADLVVLDLTIALAGPFASALFAGLGARVIKIEGPGAPDTSRNNAPYLGASGVTLAREAADDVSISALNRLRNKQAVRLNLKHPRGREVFADLVRKADVIVENYSQGTLDRLGVGYAFARAINPKLVFCSITGFGYDSKGPAKAMDAIIQALSGVMHVSGNPEDAPTRIGLPLADLVTPLFGVIGVLSALHMARVTGQGQHVDVSMLGTLTALMAGEGFDLLETLGVQLRTGPTVARLAPFGIYATRSGHCAICAPTDAFAAGLFRAMGRPELATDARFATRDARVTNGAELDALIEAWTRTRDNDALVAELLAHGVPSAEVRTPREAVRDARVLAREECVPLQHPVHGATAEVYGMGLPIKFSEAHAGFDRPAPELGEHNQLVYGEWLGYSAERLRELAELGVI
ncbi:MAG TPA: CoA transferase [Polyangiales bacterium]|nr:CoA transferase [Polyangiales bacterium]